MRTSQDIPFYNVAPEDEDIKAYTTGKTDGKGGYITGDDTMTEQSGWMTTGQMVNKLMRAGEKYEEYKKSLDRSVYDSDTEDLDPADVEFLEYIRSPNFDMVSAHELRLAGLEAEKRLNAQAKKMQEEAAKKSSETSEKAPPSPADDKSGEITPPTPTKAP